MKLSLLNSDLTITGNVNGDGKIQLNGVICGEIKSFSVTVGQSGLVHGTIDADEVIIFGTVIGKINARSIKIINGAKVLADLIQTTLSIEPGAVFRGRSVQFTKGSTKQFVPLKQIGISLNKAKDEAPDNLEKMTKKRLIDYANSIGLKSSMKLKKAEIVKAIKNHNQTYSNKNLQ